MHALAHHARRPHHGPRQPGVALVHSLPTHATRCHALADDELRMYAIAEGYGRGPAAEAAAAASLRACLRARATLGRRVLDEHAMQIVFETAATEVHQLRIGQRAYAGMASSLAVALLSQHQVTIGITGQCVGFLDREGELRPRACGQSLLLGPALDPSPAISAFARASGDRIVLTVGAVLEYTLQARERARLLSPEALLEASRVHAPERGSALVSIEV